MTDVERLAELLADHDGGQGWWAAHDEEERESHRRTAVDLLPVVDAITRQRAVDEQGALLAALRGERPFPRTELGDAINNLFGRAEAAEHALGVTRRAAEHALEVVRQERDALRAAIRWHTWAGQGHLAQLRKALGD